MIQVQVQKHSDLKEHMLHCERLSSGQVDNIGVLVDDCAAALGGNTTTQRARRSFARRRVGSACIGRRYSEGDGWLLSMGQPGNAPRSTNCPLVHDREQGRTPAKGAGKGNTHRDRRPFTGLGASPWEVVGTVRPSACMVLVLLGTIAEPPSRGVDHE